MGVVTLPAAVVGLGKTSGYFNQFVAVIGESIWKDPDRLAGSPIDGASLGFGARLLATGRRVAFSQER